mgnify:CR=1 FL=1
MNEKIEALKSSFDSELKKIANMVDLEALRVNYLGRKGKVTDALKGMGGLTDEQKKTVGRETNELKTAITVALAEKLEALKAQELQREINVLPEFDISMPPDMTRGSYHPITLVQRQCEQVFKSMGFTVEDYAAQNAIYRRYRDALVDGGVPIKAIFPGRCFRNEATDACHENTFFQMEGIMVDKDISIANLIYFMKTMLSEVFRKDIKVRLRPGFFPFVEPGFELDISCLICGGTGCPSCKHSGWLELCPCGMIHPEVLKAGGIDPEQYTGFAFGLGMTRLAMMKYGVKDIRDLNSGSLTRLAQFTDDE